MFVRAKLERRREQDWEEELTFTFRKVIAGWFTVLLRNPIISRNESTKSVSRFTWNLLFRLRSIFVHYLTVSLYSPFINSEAVEHVLRVEAIQANPCQISRGFGMAGKPTGNETLHY